MATKKQLEALSKGRAKMCANRAKQQTKAKASKPTAKAKASKPTVDEVSKEARSAQLSARRLEDGWKRISNPPTAYMVEAFTPALLGGSKALFFLSHKKGKSDAILYAGQSRGVPMKIKEVSDRKLNVAFKRVGPLEPRFALEAFRKGIF